MFVPVYQRGEGPFQLVAWEGGPRIEGIMVNAFVLYKQRRLRKELTTVRSLADYVGFSGLLITDSGAFQGFLRPLYLSNKDIVRFQDSIGSDVISPLDLVTPPRDRRSVAEDKLHATERRVREALSIAERGIVVGVQQGGRFLDLRHESVCRLMDMKVRYLAIGSLVPFFNSNHDLEFVGKVLRDARQVAGPDLPIHVYGAGDPAELPFLVALGANVFDSASYAHFARGGWYMTPYGALSEAGPLLAGEYRCPCPTCARDGDVRAVFADPDALLQHNLWTILSTVSKIRGTVAAGESLSSYLRHVLDRHMAWFPNSSLSRSWEALNG
jgi:7-cyano-7-deazaguanine tRNA-ribosyltransferase